MQAPGDNSITVVETHVETYADNNLSEKNLGTQYIYTTEGELIPASEEHNPSNADLNSQVMNSEIRTKIMIQHFLQFRAHFSLFIYSCFLFHIINCLIQLHSFRFIKLHSSLYFHFSTITPFMSLKHKIYTFSQLTTNMNNSIQIILFNN